MFIFLAPTVISDIIRALAALAMPPSCVASQLTTLDQLLDLSFKVHAIVYVVASHTMVLAPGVLVSAHDVSSWRVCLWDDL